MTALALLLHVALAAQPALSEGEGDELGPPPVQLASDRQPLCSIILALEPTDGERRAAEELQTYLKRISRAEPPILTADRPAEGVRLLVGAAAAVKLAGELSPYNLGPDGFILRSYGAEAIAIAGSNDTSTLTAVYAFLEHLGCRWYMPGEIGEVVPRERELACPALDRTEVPDFYHRVLWNNGNVSPTLSEQSRTEYADWCRKNRLGGLPADHGHAYHRWLPQEKYFADHPDYFSLVRADDGTTRRVKGRQICTSNGEVIAIAAEAANAYFEANPTALCFSLSPNDTQGWCECEQCTALDGPGPNGLSDRILAFANAVGEITDRAHPGRLLAYYALYGNLPGPPRKTRPRDNVMPVMVNNACHYHAITDSGCPRNAGWRDQVLKWHAMSKQLFAYDYFQYSDLPTPINRIVGKSIAFYHDLGMLGLSGEILGRSQVNNVALYIAARMLWDADQDPDLLLEEFYDQYYRGAREPMAAYYEALEAAARARADHAVGVSWRMYTPEVVAELHSHINLAQQEARGTFVQRRVEMAALDLKATTLFAEAAAAREAWAAGPSDETKAAALTAIGASEEFLNAIAGQDIVAEGIMLGRLANMRSDIGEGRAAPSESARSQPDYDDEATFGHLWDKYDDLGSLPATGWFFHTDPDDQGERAGWYLPTFNDTRWTPIDIGEWWEPQRGAYDGVAWYRRSIEIPEAAAGRATYLWFGAVDESAWVYLDGKLIGEHDRGEAGWATRFRIELPPDVKPGKHLLAVKVLDRKLKGGIWKSIKLVCPKAE